MSTGDGGASASRSIKASEFKAKCLKLMDGVAETGDEIVITKHGRPVSKLAPYREKPNPWFGRDQDIIQVLEDLDEPLDMVWEAKQGLWQPDTRLAREPE